MKKPLLSILCVFVFLSTVAQDASEISSKYLELYTSMRFDEIGVFYTDKSIFEDPTTSFFDPRRKYEIKTGSDDITAYLKKGFEKISNIEFNIEKQYAAGTISFSYGILNYDYMIKVEGKDKTLKIKLPLAIILEIKEGKVIHHQDIADYNEWYQQYKVQLNGTE
jgi:hypothetical protein